MKALGGALLGMYAHCSPSKCRDPQVQYQDDCASDTLQLINKKLFDLVVVATPGRSFSRDLPDEPLGHKGVSFNTFIKDDKENLELDFSPTCCAAAFSQSVACVLFHPENLCSVPSRSRRPLGILGETRDLLDWEGFFTGGACSCNLYLQDMPKPLRLLSKIEHLRHLVWEGWPELQEQRDRQVYR